MTIYHSKSSKMTKPKNIWHMCCWQKVDTEGWRALSMAEQTAHLVRVANYCQRTGICNVFKGLQKRQTKNTKITKQ
jgi:hypothetical protein